MPRFQPGANRYFGATARPLSSITASLLPSFRAPGGPGALRRPMRAPKPAPYTIGKTERLDITKKLLKMPNYVPRGTTKALKTFAQQVMTHQKQFSKEERAFAEATVHGDHTIRNAEAQKKFIEGEVAALVDIKDRRVKDTFRFSHHGTEVAGQTLRGLVKEKHEQENKNPVSDRRASIRPRSDEPMTSEAPPAAGWTAPVPLDPTAGAGQAGAEVTSDWPAPFAPAHHNAVTADAVHASAMAGLNSLSTGGRADVLILSDQLSEATLLEWSQALNLRLRRLPLATMPLIHAFPSQPSVVIVEADPETDFSRLKLSPGSTQVVIFLPPQTPKPAVPPDPEHTKIIVGELTVAALQVVLSEHKKTP